MARRSWLRATALVLQFSMLASGCGSDHGRGEGGRIEEAGSLPRFELAADPRYRISEGAPPHEFHYDLVWSALLLEDGIAAFDASASGTVALIDPTGSVAALAGRRGSGPGEFEGRLELFHLPGGGLAVHDRGDRGRLSLFGPDGDHLRDIPMPGMLNQRMLGWVAGLGPLTRNAVRPEGSSEGRWDFELRDSTGSVVRVLDGGVRPAYLAIEYEHPQLGRVLSGVQRRFESVHLHLVIGSLLYEVDTGAGTVTAIDMEGGRRELLRATGRRPIDDRVIEEFMEAHAAALDAAAGSARERRGIVDEILSHSEGFLPPWTEAVADPDGRIWLARAESEDPVLWKVIDLEGRSVREVAVPADLRVEAVRGDLLLATRMDTLDVEWVELYEVVPAVDSRRGG